MSRSSRCPRCALPLPRPGLTAQGVFEVKSTNGDTHLGGEDFDNRVIDHFAKLWKRNNDGEDISTNLRTMGKLKREVERAKRTLSSQMSVRLEIESFFNGKVRRYSAGPS